jgi:uncharacterized protein YndB with AHSA1/START domain
MPPTSSLHVEARGERDIVMIREFNSPSRLVFDAWTKPELLKRWLGVRAGWALAVCEVDLRPGGAYRYVWRNEARGKEMGAGGVFREVQPPTRFVSTESFDDPWYKGEALNEVVLVEKDGRTTVTATTTYESREARDGVLGSGMERGVAESYDVLAVLLEEAVAAGGRWEA